MKKMLASVAATVIMFSSSSVRAVENGIVCCNYNEGELSMYLKTGHSDLELSDVTADGKKTDVIEFRSADERDTIRTTLLADRSSLDEDGMEQFSGVLREILSASGENESFRLVSFGAGGMRTHSDLTANQMRILDSAEKIQYEDEPADLYEAVRAFQDNFHDEKYGVYDRLIVFTGSDTVNSSDASEASDVPDEVPAYFILTDSEMFFDFNITSLRCSTGYCAAAKNTDLSTAARLASDVSDVYFLKTKLTDDIIGNGGEKRIGVLLENSDISLSFEETVNTGDQRFAVTKREVNRLKLLVVFVTFIAVALAFILVLVLGKKKTSQITRISAESEPVPYHTKPLEKKNNTLGTILSSVSTRILFRESTRQKIILTETGKSDHVIEIFPEKETVIGRNQSMSDVMIYNERSVSQRHCRIFSRNSKIYVQDLGSLNHTYVDGEEVTEETELFSGSVLKIGRVSFDVKIVPMN